MSRYYRAKILMLKGEKGETGYSISNIQMNDDYTLTITIENGMQFNTPPIRGEKGEQGTGIQSVELRDDYSLLITLENGKTLETTSILGKEFENIRKLEASATSASKIATNASISASASAQSASEASISASESASNASISASASAQSATNSSQSATNAQESASSASTSADTATSKATEASASATKAKESETNAKSSEINASNSAKEANTSAENAKASETKAKEYADNLQASTDDISKLKEDLVANTKEDTKTKRSLSALWALNNGISYRFETDSEKAYSKQTPSGSKLGAVNAIGGRTIVYNQYANINGDTVLWADDSKFSKNINELSGHKLYIMNKCVVTKILYDDRETYNKGLILFNENDEGVINVGNTIIEKKDIAVGKVFINKDIVQAPSTLKTIRLYNIGDDNIGLTVECNSWVNIIDLTKMFGSGKEPSTVEEFEAMFPNDYYPYNEGTLMSMSVNEVENVGKNMFKCEAFSCSGLDGTYNPSLSNSYGTSINSTEPSNSVIVTQSKVGQTDVITSYCNGYLSTSFEPIILDKNYVFSFDVTPTKKLIDNAKIIILLNGSGAINVSYTQDFQVGKTTKLYFELGSSGKKLIYIEIRNSGISGVFENFQIERGTVNTSFSPYTENTYPIPQAVQNLDGYGWGVNNVYNYVDYENKKFVKYVGRVDLGTLDYSYVTYSDNEGLNVFRTSLISDMKRDENAYLHDNVLLCNKYAEIPWSTLWGSKTDKTISQSSNAINIKDSTFTDVDSFKKSLQGVYLYYELAEPVVTDISDIIEDTFQEPFNVEGGGSLTFKNSNGDGYQLAVPSDIQYIVSLKEVTA